MNNNIDLLLAISLFIGACENTNILEGDITYDLTSVDTGIDLVVDNEPIDTLDTNIDSRDTVSDNQDAETEAYDDTIHEDLLSPCPEFPCDSAVISQLYGTCCTDVESEEVHLASPTEIPIHIVGVYGCSGTDGIISIYIGCVTSPIILVLSAYDSCVWDIVEAVPGSIDQIVVHQAWPQTIVSEEADLSIYTIEGYYGTIDTFYSPATETFISALQLTIGFPVSTFQACHVGDSFGISHQCE